MPALLSPKNRHLLYNLQHLDFKKSEVGMRTRNRISGGNEFNSKFGMRTRNRISGGNEFPHKFISEGRKIHQGFQKSRTNSSNSSLRDERSIPAKTDMPAQREAPQDTRMKMQGNRFSRCRGRVVKSHNKFSSREILYSSYNNHSRGDGPWQMEAPVGAAEVSPDYNEPPMNSNGTLRFPLQPIPSSNHRSTGLRPCGRHSRYGKVPTRAEQNHYVSPDYNVSASLNFRANGPPMNSNGTLGFPLQPNPTSNHRIASSANTGPRPCGGHSRDGNVPTRAEHNDYAQHFTDTGARPQNFIRDADMSVVVEEYPQMKELMKIKDELNARRSFNPVFLKCDLRETVLSRELFGTKFDAILIDPPMEEYVRRAPGVLDPEDYWTWEQIKNLRIEDIAGSHSFVFLWVGSAEGLKEGRCCFKKWGFRRVEDICWLKTNHENLAASASVNNDRGALFKRTKEHCLVGIKNTIPPHLMHPNIDVDLIVSEEPPYGSAEKPEYLYRIIEHLVQGRRRIEIFGEDHNLQSGWLTIGNGLSSSNFSKESYVKNFVSTEGNSNISHGGYGCPAPINATHLIGTTQRIEELRPKSSSRI